MWRKLIWLSKKDFNSVALWIFCIHRNLREAQTSKINRTERQTNKQTNHRTLLKSETCLCFKRHENFITPIWIALCSTVHCVKACTPCHTWTITNTDPTAGWTASTTTCHGKLILRWRKRTERKTSYQCGYLVFLRNSPHNLFAASSTIILLQRRVAMTTRCHSLGGD